MAIDPTRKTKTNLCIAIIRQIDDERLAVKEYTELSKDIWPSDSSAVEGIALDEQKHKEILENIKEKFC